MSNRYDPKDLNELMKYCKVVVQSDLCPKHIKGPADAMMIIQRGAELGLSAVSSIQNLDVMHGKVTMPAALAVGIAKASEPCEYFTCLEDTAERSTWETKRKGNPEPTTYTFTMADAKTAQLGGNLWNKYPRNMLAARASMNLARMEYQDVLTGVYSREEMESVDGEPGTVPSIPESDARPENPPPRRPASGPEHKEAGPLEPGQPNEPEVAPDVHWTAVDYADEMEHSTDHPEWSKASVRFHAVLNDGDCGELAGDFKAFVKSRHGVESCKQIPPDVLHQWSELVSRKSHETSISEAGDPMPSDRWEWMRAKLDKASDKQEAA